MKNQENLKKMKKMTEILLIILIFSLFLTGLATWISLPDSLVLNGAISGLCLFFAGVFFLMKRKEWGPFYKTRRFRNAASTLITVFLVTSLVALFNYLGVKHPWQKDLTRNAQNSLSRQSQLIVDNIKGPVTFRVFIRRADQGNIVPLLELYRFYKKDIDIEVIDPELKPEWVNQYGIKKYGTVVVEYGRKKQAFVQHNELAITQALLKVHRQRDPILYYTTGHSEPDFESKGEQGLSHMKALAQQEFYQLRPLNLAQGTSVPADADALLILGPKTAFFENELRIIEQYMAGGGRVLIGLDPDFNRPSISSLAKTFEKWGVGFGHDLVVDLKSYVNGSQFTVPLISHYHKSHPITQGSPDQTFFPLAVSVRALEKKASEFQFTSLAQTNPFPASWAEKSFNEVILGQIHYTEGRDVKGPVAVMLAIEEKESPSGEALIQGTAKRKKKIVAIGNSTFVQNIYANYQSNFHLFLKALSWLVDEDFVLNGIGKSPEDKGPLFISAPQVGIIFYFSIVFGPLIMLTFAFYFYRKKLRS